MPTMEASLAAFEARIGEAQKSADALIKAFRDLKKAASTGHLGTWKKAWGRSPSALNRRSRPQQRFPGRPPDDDEHYVYAVANVRPQPERAATAMRSTAQPILLFVGREEILLITKRVPKGGARCSR
jgi:hypothetical protein